MLFYDAAVLDSEGIASWTSVIAKQVVNATPSPGGGMVLMDCMFKMSRHVCESL